MRITEILSEMTSAGAVAAVAQPMGTMIRRGKKPKKKKTTEREMTGAEKSKETRLKDKYDDSDMKKNMIDKYGKEKGEQIYFATIRKKSMTKGAK